MPDHVVALVHPVHVASPMAVKTVPSAVETHRLTMISVTTAIPHVATVRGASIYWATNEAATNKAATNETASVAATHSF